MQGGEIWNLGVILHAFYQGEFPFKGQPDETIISQIIQRENNWLPVWKEGLCEPIQNFIMLCLDGDPYRR
jgi:serine/threonine protein kinase